MCVAWFCLVSFGCLACLCSGWLAAGGVGWFGLKFRAGHYHVTITQDGAATAKDADDDEKDDDDDSKHGGSAPEYLDEERAEAKQRWLTFAEDIVTKNVELIPMQISDSVLRDMLRHTTPFTKARSEEHEFHLHIYNAKMDGECKTQPSIRMPVLRAQYMQRVIKSSLEARCKNFNEANDPEDVDLGEDAMYLFLDAFKPDNAGIFEKCFASGDRRIPKSRALYYLTYDESSLLARRKRVGAQLAVKVVEIMTAVTKSELNLKKQMRLTLDDTSNLTNQIGPLVTASPDSEWTMSIEEKRKFLHGDARKDAGGPLVAGQNQNAEKQRKRSTK